MRTKSPAMTAGITVGELRRQLETYPSDAELFFGGLRFSRLKSRGERVVQAGICRAGLSGEGRHAHRPRRRLMAQSALVRELKCQIEAAEADARVLRARVQEAEARAARAERSAQEAWQFARVMFRVDRKTAVSAQ